MKTVIIALAGIAIVGVVAYGLNTKYHWFPKQLKPPPKPDVTPTPQASRAPRGTMPWAIGDVGLWDDEDPTFCGKCKDVCDTSFSDGYSTECDECQSKCH